MAAAVLLGAGLAAASDAQALALGRISVQSALGEPLRAEIDIPEINADEASSLRIGLAGSDAFRAAGMDFNPALADLRVSLQRRADGRAYLRLSSTRPVHEPFLDMILEAQWSSGRIVRDYTLLFDPPNLRQATPTPLPPAVSAQPTAPRPVQLPAARPVAPPPSFSRPQVQPPVEAARPAARTERPAPATDSDTRQIRVQRGDTAGRLAANHRPANVSLDQMLVALLRANPSAFIDGNVNRIKAGAVLDLPSAADAGAIPTQEARQIISAQSRDFNEFRRRLAGAAPAAAVAAADRQASGRIQTEIEDKKPAAATQDKLTLSKGATPGQAAGEDKIAQERQSREASTRAAELSRNIEELAKLGTSTAAATPTSPATTTGVGLPVSTSSGTATQPATATTTGSPATASPGVSAAAPAEGTATIPVTTATTPEASSETTPVAAAPASQAAPAVPAPVPVEEPSFLDSLRDNPFVLPALGGLAALLAGFGLYRLRQRKKSGGVDSSFLESRLQPDSFFGSSGGQRIDTAEAAASGSSMVYSPSQLDAAGDVDPVAEADVYLAYGRDLQAEEILKEAMRSTPTRVAIHNKLLEIYAKRRDAKAFEVVATEAFALTQGEGPEWEHACELGRQLDPANPLYQPGGSPAVRAEAAGGGAGLNTVPFRTSTLSPNSVPGHSGLASLDLDLDLDEPSAPVPLAPPAPTPIGPTPVAPLSNLDDLRETAELTREPVAPLDPAGPPSMSMDFDLDFPSEPTPLAAATPAAAPPTDTPTFDRSEVLPDFDLEDEPQPMALSSESAAEPVPSPAPALDMLSFDLSDINLELDPQAEADVPAAPNGLTEENPLETKLSLAEEFRAIGDLEGARSLAEEVVAEASGALKTKASTFLADLS